jgi:hypothetical protein
LEVHLVTTLYIFSVHFMPPRPDSVPASCYLAQEHDWPSAPRVGDHVQLTPTVRSAPQGVTFERLGERDVVRMEFFEVEQDDYPHLAEGGFEHDKQVALANWN